jgi:hypothetical protein
MRDARKKKIRQLPIKDRYIVVLEKYTALLEGELKRKTTQNKQATTIKKEQWRSNFN